MAASQQDPLCLWTARCPLIQEGNVSPQLSRASVKERTENHRKALSPGALGRVLQHLGERKRLWLAVCVTAIAWEEDSAVSSLSPHTLRSWRLVSEV